MKKNIISWYDFHQDVKTLCENIKKTGSYNKIIAISRGGLIPAGIVAYELDIRNVEAVNMSSYDGCSQRADEDLEISSCVVMSDEHTLVIDDLADSGKTVEILRGLFPDAKFACVYAKPRGLSSVDIYSKSVPDDWVVFPWD